MGFVGEWGSFCCEGGGFGGDIVGGADPIVGDDEFGGDVVGGDDVMVGE
ncbi:hypothetical protein A2U01_0070164, partial [Trifolium medium]|nr:hypothetical protein [Trifolium medium]